MPGAACAEHRQRLSFASPAGNRHLRTLIVGKGVVGRRTEESLCRSRSGE
jgi:hypothetical protein